MSSKLEEASKRAAESDAALTAAQAKIASLEADLESTLSRQTEMIKHAISYAPTMREIIKETAQLTRQAFSSPLSVEEMIKDNPLSHLALKDSAVADASKGEGSRKGEDPTPTEGKGESGAQPEMDAPPPSTAQDEPVLTSQDVPVVTQSSSVPPESGETNQEVNVMDVLSLHLDAGQHQHRHIAGETRSYPVTQFREVRHEGKMSDVEEAIYGKLRDAWEERKSFLARIANQKYLPQSKDEVHWLWKRAEVSAINELIKEIENAHQLSAPHKDEWQRTIANFDDGEKAFAISALKSLGLQVYKDDEEKAVCKSGVETVTRRSVEEIEAIRATHNNARFVEDILEDPAHHSAWVAAKFNFIKYFYFWKLFKNPVFPAFCFYMRKSHLDLWENILRIANNYKYVIKAPEKQFVPVPLRPGTNVRDDDEIDLEPDRCITLLKVDYPTPDFRREIRDRIYAAYNLPTPKF